MEYILMDLDGTLTNPKLGITKSFQYALRHWNINIDNLDSLCKCIGPPLRDSFIQFFDFNEEEAQKAIVKFREYFKDTGIFENEVYEGIEAQLQIIKNSGKKIIVATSKLENFARIIIEHFNLEEYFLDICGSSLDESISTKAQVIQYALNKNGITDYSKVVMIGDRNYDIEGAKEIGIASIGVLYGFGSREEMVQAGADKICEKVEDLYNTIEMLYL